jgi:hypothetical protein
LGFDAGFADGVTGGSGSHGALVLSATATTDEARPERFVG